MGKTKTENMGAAALDDLVQHIPAPEETELPAVVQAEAKLLAADNEAPEGWDKVEGEGAETSEEDGGKPKEEKPPVKEDPLPIMNPAHRAKIRAERRKNRPKVEVEDPAPDAVD